MDSPLPSKRLITGSDPYLAPAGTRDSLWMPAQHLEGLAEVGQVCGLGPLLHRWAHVLVLLSGAAVLRGAALRQPERALLPQLLLDILLDADGGLRARVLACSRSGVLQAHCSAECVGLTLPSTERSSSPCSQCRQPVARCFTVLSGQHIAAAALAEDLHNVDSSHGCGR